MSRRAHGTYVAYVIDRCRCDDCRAANRAYERARNRRLEPPYVAAGPARAHIADLAAAGVGLKQIARVTGLSHGGLSKLVYGYKGRPPSRRIRKRTADAILAVTPRDVADGAKVEATRTWALIDEMVAAGVPKARIAAVIGSGSSGLQLARTTVSARNARAIAELYDQWRSGRVVLERHSRHGSRAIAPPPAVARARADVSELMLELADAVELRNEQPWRARAACRGRPLYLWFPSRGDALTAEHAQRICRSCLVRRECAAAMFDEPVGIYGAMSARERRRVRQEASA